VRPQLLRTAIRAINVKLDEGLASSRAGGWTRPAPTVCASCAGCTTAAISPTPGATGGVARQVAGHLPQALWLGRRAHRGDADLLLAAPPASQTSEVHQPAQAAERGDQAADPRHPHLAQRRELPAADPGAGGRDAGELAGSTPLSQHGGATRAQEGGPKHGGLSESACLWTTLRVAHKGPRPPP
jgi:hypothetical protein